ncbi:RdgB/HAM1 family non-canonical purine NTP pyrophosphatase [Moraxella oblonga]|uniref:RdgB/HAM1 family non-canonical purine NTP pyrophosphatase n=1 Tax=Moraxella oblonga TaxID=200413 RepID=UPI000830460E|nr:RdgB/HAM1 family non-canonical purine NTP pyrophosphatase [Moraxella oblonga]
MKKIVLASNNKGKLSEFQTLFDKANLGITIVPQGELGIGDAIENGLSFIENAIIKARHASRASGLPALADDSGLCVPVLGNAPGIYSARFAGLHGDDGANNTKLLQELSPYRNGTPIVGKFVCVLAYVRHGDDPLPIIAQGEWVGEILDMPQGENGFGYDPLFYVPSLGKASAELDKDTKNALSHRGQALQKLIKQLLES